MNFLKVNLLNIVRQIDDIDDFHNLCRTNKEIFKICPNNCDPFYFKDISGIELQQFKEILIKKFHNVVEIM